MSLLVGRTGKRWDNVLAESFFATLQRPRSLIDTYNVSVKAEQAQVVPDAAMPITPTA